MRETLERILPLIGNPPVMNIDIQSDLYLDFSFRRDANGELRACSNDTIPAGMSVTMIEEQTAFTHHLQGQYKTWRVYYAKTPERAYDNIELPAELRTGKDSLDDLNRTIVGDWHYRAASSWHVLLSGQRRDGKVTYAVPPTAFNDFVLVGIRHNIVRMGTDVDFTLELLHVS